ncbi:MAG: hypothetical protein Q7K65_00060 [Candidatus Buchananbacteria bacterium]|nr:hypothetical protein [Candidatus Buchananbacteria bacterium]
MGKILDLLTNLTLLNEKFLFFSVILLWLNIFAFNEQIKQAFHSLLDFCFSHFQLLPKNLAIFSGLLSFQLNLGEHVFCPIVWQGNFLNNFFHLFNK